MKRIGYFIAGISVVAVVVGIVVTSANSKGVSQINMSGEQVSFKGEKTGIPYDISYQGYLEDASGNPANGTLSMTFRIYNALTGGTQLWTGTYNVTVTKGRFSVVLNSVSATVFTGGTTRYLETVIGGQTLSPRTKLTSIGWSYQSENTDKIGGYAVSSTAPSSGQVLKYDGSQWGPGTDETGGSSYWTQTSSKLYPNSTSWSVGIGTTSPMAKLGVETGSGTAIWAETSEGYEAALTSSAAAHGYGVYGSAPSTGYGVYASGNLGCSGTKPAVVRTSKGPTEMYAMESPELWFEDFGSARLVNGKAIISLDRDFLETVTINGSNPIKVFVQLNDDCKGVYVKKNTNGFEVVELNSGISNASFDYRVLAKRKGYETQKMKVVESCYTDRFLYPNDNDPQIPLKYREMRLKDKEAEREMENAK